MKRNIALIARALLIVVIFISIINPDHVSAAGTVTIQGTVTFQPRNWNPSQNNWATGREMQIDLYERDLAGVEHYLATTTTNGAGYFVFPPMTNWWAPDNRQLNIFYKVVTAYPNASNPKTATTDRSFSDYVFASGTNFLSSDGTYTINFAISNSWQNYQALWVYEDVRNAWDYVYNNDYVNGRPYDPGSVTAVWEQGLNCWPIAFPDWTNINNCASFAYGGILTHFIFINFDSNNASMDVVAHETGHMFMINANGYWYTNCRLHYITKASDANCAWTEGWADAFPLFVNHDHCYNISAINPCQGSPDTNYYDLEAHNVSDNYVDFNWGDYVEGRVAAALYDFYDSNNEGYDSIWAGFEPIAHIALGPAQITTFHDFWNQWTYSSGQGTFQSGLTLWWNTIGYIYISWTYLPIIMK